MQLIQNNTPKGIVGTSKFVWYTVIYNKAVDNELHNANFVVDGTYIGVWETVTRKKNVVQSKQIQVN